MNHRVVSQAVVIATGVAADGRREMLGMEVGDFEDCAFRTAFLRSLISRGLAGVQLVISDAHSGLRAAIRTISAQPDAEHVRELDTIAGMLGRRLPKVESMLREAPDKRCLSETTVALLTPSCDSDDQSIAVPAAVTT